MLIIGGYQYSKNKFRSKNGAFHRSYWTCLKYRSNYKCKARAILEANSNVTLRYDHNHPPLK